MSESKSTVIILPETTRKPITLIGKRAGVCWGADITDDNKNYKRGIDCLEKNHGRTLEYINIEAVFKGWSARVIREWYTHIGGSPTRLQASTRYINYEDFDYVVPDSIKKNSVALNNYKYMMKTISDVICFFENELKIPREDIANLLPLGMSTTIVDKRNLRNVIDMSRQRMCLRAYKEYRDLFETYMEELKKIDDEWCYIVEKYFKPKCEILGYCPEGKNCKKKGKS